MRPRFLDRRGLSERLAVMQFGAESLVATLMVAVALLAIGCEIPPPTPGPGPQPPPIVVTEGQRIALILHESQDQNPELARLIVDLQAGNSSAYFAKHHHSVFALDINAKDENKHPLAVITRLLPTIGSKPLPVLIVADKTNEGRLGKVLYCESIKKDAVGGDVVSAVKKTGGGE